MSFLVMAIIAAFLISLMTTPLVKKLAIRIGAVDKPNERKVHARIMPRLGGLAIFISFVIVVIATQTLDSKIIGLLLGSALIIIIGIVDDIKELSAKVKLAGQILAAGILVFFGVEIAYVTIPFFGSVNLGDFSIPVTILWVIGVTNAINLIDGLDGLAAGTSAIAAIIMAVVAWDQGLISVAYIALVLAAAALGFLRYNFHPAKIFMGDTGSMFLGYTLAVLAIMGLTKGVTVISLFTPVLILGFPILDTLFAIIRRFANNQPIFQPDKEHLHHRLLAIGFSHKQTVLTIYGVHLCLGGSAVLLTKLTTAEATISFIIISTLVILAADRIGVFGQAGSTRTVDQKQNFFGG